MLDRGTRATAKRRDGSAEVSLRGWTPRDAARHGTAQRWACTAARHVPIQDDYWHHSVAVALPSSRANRRRRLAAWRCPTSASCRLFLTRRDDPSGWPAAQRNDAIALRFPVRAPADFFGSAVDSRFGLWLAGRLLSLMRAASSEPAKQQKGIEADAGPSTVAHPATARKLSSHIRLPWAAMGLTPRH
jgi:hypothetical protein